MLGPVGGGYSWFEPLLQFDDFWPYPPIYPTAGASVSRTSASAFQWGSVSQTDSHAYFMARLNTPKDTNSRLKIMPHFKDKADRKYLTASQSVLRSLQQNLY